MWNSEILSWSLDPTPARIGCGQISFFSQRLPASLFFLAHGERVDVGENDTSSNLVNYSILGCCEIFPHQISSIHINWVHVHVQPGCKSKKFRQPDFSPPALNLAPSNLSETLGPQWEKDIKHREKPPDTKNTKERNPSLPRWLEGRFPLLGVK